MELSKEQRAFVKRIMDAVPDNVYYHLNIVRISGKGWSAIAPSGRFIEDSLKCAYVVVSDGGDKESEYIPLPEEVELIKAMMNEVSLRENGWDLSDLWKQREE